MITDCDVFTDWIVDIEDIDNQSVVCLAVLYNPDKLNSMHDAGRTSYNPENINECMSKTKNPHTHTQTLYCSHFKL